MSLAIPKFNIVCIAPNNTLAVTGSFNGGGPVTLQKLDPGNTAQQWQAPFQIADGFTGTAFVISDAKGIYWSVTFNGFRNQLVMQTFEYGSGDQDSWLIADVQDGGICRLQYPQDTTWSWNDIGGNFQPGDEIGMWDDAGDNSLWQIVFID